KAAAETFRINPELNVAAAITELRVGEALVSTLMPDGAPSIVQRTLIKPPRSCLGPLDASERKIIQSPSPVSGRYDERIDRESAHEMLLAKMAASASTVEAAQASGGGLLGRLFRAFGKAGKRAANASTGSAISAGVAVAMGKKS